MHRVSNKVWRLGVCFWLGMNVSWSFAQHAETASPAKDQSHVGHVSSKDSAEKQRIHALSDQFEMAMAAGNASVVEKLIIPRAKGFDVDGRLAVELSRAVRDQKKKGNASASVVSRVVHREVRILGDTAIVLEIVQRNGSAPLPPIRRALTWTRDGHQWKLAQSHESLYSKWEKSIADYEREDERSQTQPGVVVFLGSSSIRGWKTMQQDFSEHRVLGRGFGGSQLIDSVLYSQRLVTKHRPAAVAIYAGDNDVAAGKSAQRVHADFRAFVDAIHRELPECQIGFIAIKPSHKRWNLWPIMHEANELIREDCERNPRLDFLDIATPMLGGSEMPAKDLFVQDGLHMTGKGYELWTSVVKPWVNQHGVKKQEHVTTGESFRFVFQAGVEGYPIYRIPALIQTANGDLLALCEARQKGDASEIDIVSKRSKDGGKTWSPLKVVLESDNFRSLFGEDPPPITVGNPAPVVDQLSPQHAGRIWLPFTVENHFVFVVYSDDHGETWSEPREITDKVKPDSWGWYATGPGHSIQLMHGPTRGRIVIPSDHRLGENGADSGPNGAHVILSDDHGETWRLGAIDATYDDGLNANETTAVELPDGRLYFNTRDQHGKAPGTRGEAWSLDGGYTLQSGDESWGSFRPTDKVLDLPVVQASLVRLGERLILSGPDENGPSGKGRSDLRLRISQDSGESWSDGPLIHVGPAAYSDLITMNESTLGILYEAGEQGQKSAYQGIRFQWIDTNQLEPVNQPGVETDR